MGKPADVGRRKPSQSRANVRRRTLWQDGRGQSGTSCNNLTELLNCATGLSRKEIIKYLLELGAQPNDKANGAWTAMDRCLLHLPHKSIDALIHRRQVSSWEVRRTMESLGELVKHGAIWRPDDSRQMDYIRRGLYQVNPEVTVDLLELFVKTKCCSSETIQSLLRTPRIRQHLKPYEQRLLRLRLDLRTAREKAEQARVEAEQARIKATRQAYVLASRYNRERLYEEVWSEPVILVAKKYSLSDVGLAKICKKLNIPRPGLGYWAKKAAAKPVEKPPPLPPLGKLD